MGKAGVGIGRQGGDGKACMGLRSGDGKVGVEVAEVNPTPFWGHYVARKNRVPVRPDSKRNGKCYLFS